MAGKHLRTLLSGLALIISVTFGEVLFTDDFSSGNDDGWTHLGAAEYEVVSQEYLIYSSGDRGQGTSLNGDQSGVMSVADYSVLSSITIEAGRSAGLVCRYNGPSDWYYRLVLKPLTGKLVLERRNDSGATLIMDELDSDILFDTAYLVRLQVEGDQIQGRLWTGFPEDEPAEWLVTADDGVQGEAGSFGVFGGGNGKVSWSIKFDDVVVSTPLPESLQSGTWAGIKSVSF